MQIHCASCQSVQRQNKAGFTRSGSQHYFCTACDKTYTPVAKERGYSKELRRQAVAMRLEGTSQRKTARLLGVAVQSVGNWFQEAQQRLEQSGEEPLPPEAKLTCAVIEMDELYSFK